MRVKLSSEAQQDIQAQIAYLRGRTNSGIASFRDTVRRGLTLVRSQPDARFTDSKIPIRGAKRVIVDGWYFDYDVIEGSIWVHRITSSVNTPSFHYDDDADYEVDK